MPPRDGWQGPARRGRPPASGRRVPIECRVVCVALGAAVFVGTIVDAVAQELLDQIAVGAMTIRLARSTSPMRMGSNSVVMAGHPRKAYEYSRVLQRTATPKVHPATHGRSRDCNEALHARCPRIALTPVNSLQGGSPAGDANRSHRRKAAPEHRETARGAADGVSLARLGQGWAGTAA